MTTLTAAPAAAPPPSIEIVGEGMPFAAGYRITLYRTQENRRVAVRGALDQPMTGAAASWLDYETGFGVPITYTVEIRTAAGVVVGTFTSDPATLDIRVPWISDPFDPANACAVLPADGSLSEWNQDRPGDALDIATDPDRVAVTGIRHSADAIPLSFLCFTAADVAAVLRVLTEADPFLWRSPADRPGGRAWYLTGKQLHQVNHRWQGGEVVATVGFGAVSVVRAPAANVVVPIRVYAVLPTEASRYGDMPGVYTPPTYLSVRRGRMA